MTTEAKPEGRNVGLSAGLERPRFYVSHGMIHDRITGQHVTTEDAIEPGATGRALALLNSLAPPVCGTTYDDLDATARMDAVRSNKD